MANVKLTECARMMEHDTDRKVVINNFEDFESFMSYFNQHYRPMLERMQQEDHSTLMGFFIDDILDAFSDDEA